jgi:hypothetical protein
MTPINFLDGVLIRHALFEGQRSLRAIYLFFGTKEGQERHSQNGTGSGCAEKDR